MTVCGVCGQFLLQGVWPAGAAAGLVTAVDVSNDGEVGRGGGGGGGRTGIYTSRQGPEASLAGQGAIGRGSAAAACAHHLSERGTKRGEALPLLQARAEGEGGYHVLQAEGV